MLHYSERSGGSAWNFALAMNACAEDVDVDVPEDEAG
jgi:hypothetical protein